MDIYSLNLSLSELEAEKQKNLDDCAEFERVYSEQSYAGDYQKTIEDFGEEVGNIQMLIDYRTGANRKTCPVCWINKRYRNYKHLRKHIESQHADHASLVL